MDVFIDFARRMDFRDKDGAPLIAWETPEQAFEAWKRCSAGRPCDYTGITYQKLTGGSGVQWPCNEAAPDGTERLYADHRFPTAWDECGDFGHDVETGAARTKEEYKAEDPNGRAILKAADYHPPAEEPDDAYPFRLTTGRVVYQFHTRTKTGRSAALNAAAPEPFAQVSEADATRLGVTEGETLEVATRRGTVRAPAKVGGIEPGHVFMPFHYGYWDDDREYARAANELTLTVWDPVSKQPAYKFAAAQVRKAEGGSAGARVMDAAGKVVGQAVELADKVKQAAHAERARVGDYVHRLIEAHAAMVEACDAVAKRHAAESEVRLGLAHLAEFSTAAQEALRPFAERYGGRGDGTASKLRGAVLSGGQTGSFGLLRDLHGVFLVASDVHVSTSVVMHASKMLRDEALLAACMELDRQNKRQLAWANTQLLARAPQTLVVPQ
jgi:hypothetical protein